MTAHSFRLLGRIGRYALTATFLGATVLTGCGGSSSGSTEVESASTTELSSAVLRTLDPCALLRPVELRNLNNAGHLWRRKVEPWGGKVPDGPDSPPPEAQRSERTQANRPGDEPRIDVARGAEFGICQAMIPRKTRPSQLNPGEFNDQVEYANVVLNLAAPKRERIGSGERAIGAGFTAAPARLEPERGCGAIIFTPVGIPFELSSMSPGRLPTAELCSVNDEARSIVLRGLTTGRAKKLTVGPRSLHSQSPCEVLQPSVQARWPQARMTPGTWSCDATDAGTSETVRLGFKLSERLGSDASDAHQLTVAGQPAVQSSVPGTPKACRVEVRYGEFPGGLGRAIETVEVVATGKAGDPDAACRLAISTLEAVFQRLG